jgi:hypothetical protein
VFPHQSGPYDRVWNYTITMGMGDVWVGKHLVVSAIMHQTDRKGDWKSSYLYPRSQKKCK